ncbi:hypothetical protein Rsub_08988 [Raphidocelis subcapitata]|uniref:Uncharacterized protein n=1 Tax=Raphidocelis subcapitata TaxID=307507 RepID=A0A2V0PB00_9CHLO|nr:hypothetical protein Rsub_08988 [Raphidocelis subcapitata]|eukprot:GBF96112.1 hypothetical protein Rsub_08988 [Raphidocelis subcapitata]
MHHELFIAPNAAALAAIKAAASSPCPTGAVGCKRPRVETFSCCSLGTGLNLKDFEERPQWPECETCGKQDLLHLSCNKCASPVCGDCVSGKCGVCGADLQLAFRGCDLCGRVLRRRGTRMCVHCTETWCFSCIDRVGTCGCGELTEEGFLRPLEEVEAPTTGRGGAQPVPCLSTASSCNLAVCMADTASSEPAGAAPAVPRHEVHADSGAATAARGVTPAGVTLAMPLPEGLRLPVDAAAGAVAALAAGALLARAAAAAAAGDDDDGPQCSSTGGCCI